MRTSRLIPDGTVAQIMEANARDKWVSPLDVEQRASALEFQNVIGGLHERMYDTEEGTVAAGKLLRWLVNTTGYLKHFDNFYGVGLNSNERKDAVLAFVCFAEENGRPTEDFLSYLEHLKPSQGKPAEQCVMMTTIFKVKGEEFDHVIMPGCIQGALPCGHFTSNPIYDKLHLVTEPLPSNHLENERRLFYVGITRARKSVLISTSTAPKYGQQEAARLAQSSQFLEEMQHDVTSAVMGEFQRSALSNFSDMSRLSEAAVKYASRGEIVQSLIENYLARRNLSLPAEVCNRIAATPRVPFAYRHSYSIGAVVTPASTNQPQVPKKRSW